jgi:hypothetical protein
MDAKTFSLIAGLIFTLVALLHLVRICGPSSSGIGRCRSQ